MCKEGYIRVYKQEWVGHMDRHRAGRIACAHTARRSLGSVTSSHGWQSASHAGCTLIGLHMFYVLHISCIGLAIDYFFFFFFLSLWIYLWPAETSQQPLSQTTWLKVILHCNNCNHCIGLARTVYLHCIWPYVWWSPCKKYRMHTVYNYLCMVLANPNLVRITPPTCVFS